jgi:hypothetical protein
VGSPIQRFYKHRILDLSLVNDMCSYDYLHQWFPKFGIVRSRTKAMQFVVGFFVSLQLTLILNIMSVY